MAPFRDGDGVDAFERAVAFVLQQEGGLSTDPNDPGNYTGGRFVGTKYGISARSYPNLDIANLTLDEAKEIYQRDYWQASGADKLPWPLSLTVLDFAVNAGVGAAHQALKESGQNFAAFNTWRRAYYQRLKQFDLYGQAWLRRVAAVENEAKKGK